MFFASAFAIYMQVYRGYVDDLRNTDNAWIETVAFNFYDEGGRHLGENCSETSSVRAVQWPT